MSTIERKVTALKTLVNNGVNLNEPTEIIVFLNTTTIKAKGVIRDAYQDYLKMRNIPINIPKYKNEYSGEVYVPNPNMVRSLLYRIHNVKVRTRVLIAIETGATASEVWRLKWENLNLLNKTLTIEGTKGHRNYTYEISDELITLLMQLPKNKERIFSEIKHPEHMNDILKDYVQRLAIETGNTDYLKIHFHTLRHYAISWKYFKCKDIVETQRFARHSRIENTLKYVHIIKSWIKENEYDVIYATTKEEFSKYLSEGYTFITTTEWGHCLTKPKSLIS